MMLRNVAAPLRRRAVSGGCTAAAGVRASHHMPHPFDSRTQPQPPPPAPESSPLLHGRQIQADTDQSASTTAAAAAAASASSRGWARRFRLPTTLLPPVSWPSLPSGLQLAQAQALLSSAGAAASNLPAALRGLPVSWPAALRSLPVSWPSLPSLSALPALPLVDPRLLRLPKLRLGALRPRGSATAAADETDVPELTYQPTAFNRAILALTPLLQQPYVPTFWMRSAHAQTILATLLRRRPPVLYNRQILHLSEANHGGCLALDWDSGHWSTTGDIGVIEPYTGPTPERPCLERTEPILFLLPGLTGGSRSRYLCQCIALARQKGWRSVVFNFRGVLIPMSTPRPSTGVDITDVQEAFVHVQACYPRAPVIAMGFSMGANMLVKTLGTWGSGSASTTNGTNDSSDSSSSSSSGSGRDGDIVSPGGGSMRLVGAAAVSCAFDFKKLARNLHKPVNKLLYSRFLTLQLKRQYIRHPAWEHLAPRVAGLDLARALSAQTIWDLDERFTRHLYGIGDVEDYYDRQSSKYLVSHVRTPLLCLNAHDDPFEGEIPLEDIKTNAHILLATTKKGGHVAWSQGANPLAQNSSWMIATTMQYLEAVLTVHQNGVDSAVASAAAPAAAPSADSQAAGRKC